MPPTGLEHDHGLMVQVGTAIAGTVMGAVLFIHRILSCRIIEVADELKQNTKATHKLITKVEVLIERGRDRRKNSMPISHGDRRRH